MLGRLNHVAIAVPDLTVAVAQYEKMVNTVITAPQRLEAHGVIVVFIELPNTKIELLEPINETSPIADFLDKNPKGGIHHVCYEVEDIGAAQKQLVSMGARILGDGQPQTGAHGKPVIFLHPGDFFGTLIELEQRL